MLQPNITQTIYKNFKNQLEYFGAVLETTAEQREDKYQLNKFSDKLKQYVLQEFHNPEDIIVIVRYVEYPMDGIDTSRHTSLSTEYENNPIIVMVQTEEIKK